MADIEQKLQEIVEWASDMIGNDHHNAIEYYEYMKLKEAAQTILLNDFHKDGPAPPTLTLVN